MSYCLCLIAVSRVAVSRRCRRCISRGGGPSPSHDCKPLPEWPLHALTLPHQCALTSCPLSHFGQPACSSQLAPASPDSASSQPPAAEADASPSHPADMSPPLLQQPQLLQPATPQSRQNTEASSPPSSQLLQGTPVPQTSSGPMSIPSSAHPQPSSEQSPESSSAPSDIRGHIHCWPQHTSTNQEDSPVHQLPQASPSCHFEQGTASHEGHHGVRRFSALHHSRSSRGKPDGGHGHGIRWNDSRDSLLSSQDDFAQLVPDRASKGGVEQAPEVASFTGQLCTRLAMHLLTSREADSVLGVLHFGIVSLPTRYTAGFASLFYAKSCIVSMEMSSH